MAFAFDTLGYAKRLREAVVSGEVAEAHSGAARDFIMTELVTKSDLHREIGSVRTELEHQTLRLTVRLGGLIATGVAALAAPMRLS